MNPGDLVIVSDKETNLIPGIKTSGGKWTHWVFPPNNREEVMTQGPAIVVSVVQSPDARDGRVIFVVSPVAAGWDTTAFWRVVK